MPTYKQIQEYIKTEYGFNVRSSWIAHVKEMCGLNPIIAPNRKDRSKRIYPCPSNKIVPILKAFKHFKMIK